MILREPLGLGESQEIVKKIRCRRDGEVLGSKWGDRDTEEESAGRGMQKKYMRGRMWFLGMDMYLYEQEACCKSNPQM